METAKQVLSFKNGKNAVYIENNAVRVVFTLRIEEEEGEFFVEFPAFGIRFSTFTPDEIDAKSRLAIQSFFDFRFKQQGKDQFIQTMLELGFVVKMPNKIPLKRKIPFLQSFREKQTELVLA